MWERYRSGGEAGGDAFGVDAHHRQIVGGAAVGTGERLGEQLHDVHADVGFTGECLNESVGRGRFCEDGADTGGVDGIDEIGQVGRRRCGGPASVAFAQLEDWRNRPESGIRFYSGKATYRTTFDGVVARAIALGEVRNMASVRVNGKELGVAWCAPWQVVIPAGLLRPKGNRLEITVANLWANRLIGDAGLPPERRITRTTWSPYRADSPLLPSGLLGPVRLLR